MAEVSALVRPGVFLTVVHLLRSIDELLAAGAAVGEDATVAEAHAVIRADGLRVG